jgi:hypothetical protein
VNCRIGPWPLLLNNVAMVDSHFVAARVSPEMKARLRALAEKRQTSESALLKRLLEMSLEGVTEVQLGNTGSAPRFARDARLYVRLWPDDQPLLAERAAARGMPAATYVSVLVRGHLRHMGPLPKDELQALKGAIAQLGAVGRNLNQIAHVVRQGGASTRPRREDVETMLRICTALRDHFKATLLANLRSWKDGYDSPRS